MFRRKVPKIGSSCSISELLQVSLGDYKQWIYIRGNNRANPVLLILHGGPGAAQIGFCRKFQEQLEKHFVVVNWDQRGSGLSYSKKIPSESMTINQFVNDAIQLTQFLCEEFTREDIYLVGHSWGTIIGLLAVAKQPNLVKRYFGVSQVVNYEIAEKLSYEKLLDHAKTENNQKAYEQLCNIGPPPWHSLKSDRVHQKYTEKFGGGISHDGKLVKMILKELLLSKEYTLMDVLRHVQGQFFSLNSLQAEIRTIDFFSEIKRIEVPIYFCMGKHDLTVPYELTKDFYHGLEATEKHWITFEKSAHSPNVEEKTKFAHLLLSESEKDR